MDLAQVISQITVSFIPLMLGIILHEVAHGWMAKIRGDSTAAMLGRLTLNPIPHIDPIGLIVFVVTSLSGSFVFGWAKPVPINPSRFKNFVKDTMLVSFAGPACNFLLAIFFAIALNLLVSIFPYTAWKESSVWEFFFLMCRSGIVINLSLAWINLIPIPPLDGSKIVWGVLPPNAGYHYMKLERYGMLILVLLIVTNFLGIILVPLVQNSYNLIISIFITG